MRVMVFVKATADSEAGIMPTTELFEAMGKYNEELVNAGIMLGGDGLKPSSAGKRIAFDGPNRTVIDGPFTETREVLEDYLKAHGLSVDAAISLTQDEYRQLRVRGTPTLILTDHAGVIRGVWVGRIRPELEEAVLADLVAPQ